MHHEMVRELLSTKPFAPIVVRMASGEVHRIVSPESVIGRRTAQLSLADGLTMVAVELIEEVRDQAEVEQ